MREKTRRIARHRWPSTKTGGKWQLAVGLVALLAVAASTFGQWPGYEQEAIRQTEYLQLRQQQEAREMHERTREGRRQVLEQLLEQLRNQARETEEVLQQHRAQQEQGAQHLNTELEKQK